MFKKLLTLGIIVSIASAVQAQSIKLGIKGGYNLAKLVEKMDGVTVSTENYSGFMAGAYVDLKLGIISIQPGLVYSSKGGKLFSSYSYSDGSATYEGSQKAKVSLNYLEVPVNLLYHVPIVVGNIYFGAGPYAAMGLSGKQSYSVSGNFPAIEEYDFDGHNEKVTFGSGEDDVKRIDYGLNAQAGLRLKGGLDLGINYGLGLANISNDSDYKTRNRVWSFTVGYFF